MSRFGNWLKTIPVNIVILLYLGGMALGTADYFTGKHFPFAWTVGIGLALAAELHSYIVQLHVRTLNAQRGKLNQNDPTYTKLTREYKLQLRAMFALIGFSIFNSVAFWATELHPTTWQDWAQAALRGCIVPVLFYVAGHLHPIAADATDMLAQANERMLKRTMQALTNDMKKRIESAEAAGHDFTPLTVALLKDVGKEDEARRIQVISDGLRKTEQSATRTKPGTSRQLYSPSAQTTSGAVAGNFPVHSAQHFPPIRMPRRVSTKTPKAKVYRVLDASENGAIFPISELAKAAKVDEKTARRWKNQWCQERSISLVV